MQNIYNEFVKLSLQQCRKEDYADKAKVKVHNEAMQGLKKLEAGIEQNREVLLSLLLYEDDRVKMNAASFCLRKNVFLDRAIPVLRGIVKSSDDPTFRLSAAMLLLKQQD